MNYTSISKEQQLIDTLSWLEENFTRCPGVCLPRCIMYSHYLSFCEEKNYKPACAATFGKVIRQKFPELTTRRLGTRGNSKYHYYGVAIRETSTYYHTVLCGKGFTRFSGSKLLNKNYLSRKIMSSSKLGTLLPEFPTPNELNLPNHVEQSKMDTFMIMYRTHCQCILDTAVSKNFDGIHHYLVHFWQGIPKHLKPLFEVKEIVGLVCICDSMKYMVLNDILVPLDFEDVSDEYLADVKNFVNNLELWLFDGLKNHNDVLRNQKLRVTRQFVQSVRRQISFLQLAKSFREVFSDETISMNLFNELSHIDMKSVRAQAIYTTVDCAMDQSDLHSQYLSQLVELLRYSAPLESYITWLEEIFQTQVEALQESYISFKLRAQEFFLSWSFFGTQVMHMLTVNNSRAYGPFHLIRMMLDEYLLLITETRFHQQERQELEKLSKDFIKESSTDKALVMTKVVTKSKFGAPSNTFMNRRDHSKKNEENSSKNRRNGVKRKHINELSELSSSTDHLSSSSIALTPPSSPQSTSFMNNDRTTTKVQISHNQLVETYNFDKDNCKGGSNSCSTGDAEHLVNEHFKNSGFGKLTTDATQHAQTTEDKMDSDCGDEDLSYLSSFLASDDIEQSPLQTSFSQILRGDVLFGDVLNSSNCTSNLLECVKRQNLSNSFSSSIGRYMIMDSVGEQDTFPDLCDEDLAEISEKQLELSF